MQATFKVGAASLALVFATGHALGVAELRVVTGIQREFGMEDNSTSAQVYDHSLFLGPTPLFTNNFATDKTVRLTIAAPAGMEFQLTNPPPSYYIYMRLQTDVPNPIGPYFGAQYDGFSIEDLEGTPGGSASFSQFNNTNSGAPFFFFEAALNVPTSLSFTQINLDFTFPDDYERGFSNQPMIITAWAGREYSIDTGSDLPAQPPDWVSLVPVPAPGAAALLGVGAGLLARRRR